MARNVRLGFHERVEMERLFHVSDQAEIKRFEPRVSPSENPFAGDDKVVWAIGERLLHNYLFPRDCPRVTFYAGAQTTESDVARFWQVSTAKYIVAIESSWVPQMLAERLYCYEFASETFEKAGEVARYYLSREAVEPIAVTVYSDLFLELARRGVEVRILPSLWPLRDAVVDSSVHFSIIRMRNAQPREILGVYRVWFLRIISIFVV
jgi:hypothetical protein